MPAHKVPTKLRILRGNPSKRPIQGGEPEPRQLDGEPTPPAWIDKIAAAKWRELAPELHRIGLLTVCDCDTFAILCQAFAEVVAATKLIAKYGRTFESQTGAVGQHAAVGMQRTAMEKYAKFSAMFGMSPESRSGMQVNVDKGKESKLDTLRRQEAAAR